MDDLIYQAKLQGMLEEWINALYDLRKDVIDLGNELDEADFDIWLANHQGLLDDDINA